MYGLRESLLTAASIGGNSDGYPEKHLLHKQSRKALLGTPATCKDVGTCQEGYKTDFDNSGTEFPCVPRE